MALFNSDDEIKELLIKIKDQQTKNKDVSENLGTVDEGIKIYEDLIRDRKKFLLLNDKNAKLYFEEKKNKMVLIKKRLEDDFTTYYTELRSELGPLESKKMAVNYMQNIYKILDENIKILFTPELDDVAYNTLINSAKLNFQNNL